ncbi:MAG: hypothetical protein HeimC2_00470 [Candidatus Heimdallarchaeota archaeon LC_2]|nr:MAG: hypothetical protein HeimC2_00470 [Candidatus Heimdallarchaeota archaeon LC_2]
MTNKLFSTFYYDYLFNSSTIFKILSKLVDGVPLVQEIQKEEVDDNRRTRSMLKDIIEKVESDENSEKLNKHIQLIGEIIDTRFLADLNMTYVSNLLNKSSFLLIFVEFEQYIFQILKYYMIKNIELLDNLVVPLSNLRSGDVNRVIEQRIEKKIHDEFYGTYDELFKFMTSIKLTVTINDYFLNMLYFYKEVRNILIHNNGQVNAIFLSRVSNEDNYSIGDTIIITDAFLRKSASILDFIVGMIDSPFTRKCEETMVTLEKYSKHF